MTGFLPIVHRELSLASRRSGTYWTRVGTAALVGGVLFAIAGATNQSATWVSQIIFRFLTVMTFAYCLLAGVRFTADSLSEERREGTLGLLFLTDLRGYDVAIGKLAVTSLNAFFGLLAAIPLLAVPVMMGGVSMAEFWRITFVLINTLFFSLAVGLAVSAFGVNERNVMWATLLCLMLATFGLPLWWYSATKFVDSRWLDCLLLFPSPAYAFKISGSGLFAGVPSDFWWCMLAIFGISLVCVVAASLRLPHSFEEPNPAPKADRRRTRSHRLAFGSDRVRARLRRYLHRGQPYLWRVRRDQTMGHYSLLLAVVIVVFGAFSLVLISSGSRRVIEPILFGWFAVHWLIKLVVATEACRPLNEDKRIGALELLLCTSLRPAAMIEAQCQRHRRLFIVPILLVCGINLLIAATAPDKVLATMFRVGALMLLPDCWALRWTGMQYGLVCRSFTRAVFSTIWRVIVPPWIALFVIILLHLSGRSPNSDSAFCSHLVMWGIGSTVYACWLVATKRFVLARDFRRMASDDTRARPTVTTSAVPLLANNGRTKQIIPVFSPDR